MREGITVEVLAADRAGFEAIVADRTHTGQGAASGIPGKRTANLVPKQGKIG
jgi:hypothetical protein